jgi:hypothetical protein
VFVQFQAVPSVVIYLDPARFCLESRASLTKPKGLDFILEVILSSSVGLAIHGSLLSHKDCGMIGTRLWRNCGTIGILAALTP